MEENALPLGVGMALAQHPQAMEKFSRMTDAEKSQVLAQAHQAASKEEMQSLVKKLAR